MFLSLRIQDPEIPLFSRSGSGFRSIAEVKTLSIRLMWFVFDLKNFDGKYTANILFVSLDELVGAKLASTLA
jgi:hypothetical protein